MIVCVCLGKGWVSLTVGDIGEAPFIFRHTIFHSDHAFWRGWLRKVWDVVVVAALALVRMMHLETSPRPSRCCPDQPGVCVDWRAQNAAMAAAVAAAPSPSVGASAGAPAPGTSATSLAAALAPAVAPGVVTNFCSFPGQICSINGTMLRLDMRGFNLQCPFPGPEMSMFSSLTTLNLGRNPNMTVRWFL